MLISGARGAPVPIAIVAHGTPVLFALSHMHWFGCCEKNIVHTWAMANGNDMLAYLWVVKLK